VIYTIDALPRTTPGTLTHTPHPSEKHTGTRSAPRSATAARAQTRSTRRAVQATSHLRRSDSFGLSLTEIELAAASASSAESHGDSFGGGRGGFRVSHLRRI